MKKLILSFLIFIFCLLYVNIIFAEQIVFTSDGKEVLLKDNGTWEYLKDNSQKGYNTLPIGATVKIANFKFRLNSVRFSNESMFSSPESGYVWLILDCTITNLSNKAQGIPGFGFTLRDKEGYSQKISFSAKTKGSLSGIMSPGQTIRGEIAYEVEQNQTYWEFFFKPGLIGLDQIIYSISEEQVK